MAAEKGSQSFAGVCQRAISPRAKAMRAGRIGEKSIAGIQPCLSRLRQERRTGVVVKIAHERRDYAVLRPLRQNTNREENVFLRGTAAAKLPVKNEACEDIVF
jgi:hypothetical protein